MSCREILLFPTVPLNILLRALPQVPPAHPELVAVVVPVTHSSVTAVRFYTRRGRPAEIDLAPYGLLASSGNYRAGVARINPSKSTRSWTVYLDGVQTAILTDADELYIPYTDEGMPDLDADPVRLADGVPEGWRLLRTCLDLGMNKLVSCRYTPVARELDRLRAGRSPGARAYALSSGGVPLSPPQEVPLSRLFQR